MKQPPKRPRATAKTAKKAPIEQLADDSTNVSGPIADLIPPEVHDKPTATPEPPKSTPEAEAQTAEPAPDTSTPAPAAPKQRSIFVPMLLGGVIAGTIGFAVANLTMPAGQVDLDELIAVQDARLTAMQEQIASQEPVDLAPVTAAQDDIMARVDELQDDLSMFRTDVEDRIATLESAPMAGGGDGVVPSTAAFEAEIDALRAQLAEMTDIARTELDAARAEAAQIEENAATAARNAAGRAALARLQANFESGVPLGAAIGDLEDVLGGPAPDALLAAQDGVPTLVTLQDSFPDYARAALTMARAEGVAGEDSTGVGAFLRNQFQVRSVNPRDGDDVDATLSRAQAALRNGRLAETLSEIGTLPDVARAEMSDWLALAEMRADALAAIDTLATSLRDK